MSLAAGARLGPYDILALIGAGGMGEVYRARDTTLHRDVALKILPAAFANDPDRLARLTREARALASLNHPHIAHIHGLEESGGVRALVMELVEGEDLAQRLAHGPVPIDEALPIARQIAEALEAAHAQGIVHRDLKPANIKIRPDGIVKVLDFGLAKAIDPDASSTADAMNAPTMSAHATRAGVILGTAAYMSPEQARGRTVDKRSDIWAFGCVLYEMLTGRPAFDGDDLSEIAAAVIKEEPRWEAVPAAARRLVKKCLQKDPMRRLRDIGDAWELWDETSDPSGLASHSAARPASRFGAVGWSLAALVLTAFAALAFVHFRELPGALDLVRFQIPAPDSTAITSLSVSPDGRQVAFTARATDGRNLLWVRSLKTLEARPLPGIESDSSDLFWSPDSRWIGFASQGTINKVEASGGPAQPVCDFQGIFVGAAWSDHGVIVFGTRDSGGLMQVSDGGGTPVPLVALEHPGAQEFQAYPAVLPDDRHFLYQRYSSSSEARGIYVGSLSTKPEQQESKRLMLADSPVVYAASENAHAGYLIFRRGTLLMAQMFNTDRRELVGEAVSIADGQSSVAGPPAYSVSSTGVLVYRKDATAESQLRWYDHQGKPLGSLGQPGEYGEIQIAPDGKKVVAGIGAVSTGSIGGTHLWMTDTALGIFSRLNPGDAADLSSAISIDGRIAFGLLTTGGVSDIYIASASGVGTPELLVKSELQKHPNHISLDGRFLIYDVHTLTMRQDLWILPLEGDRKPIPFLTTTDDETFGQFSPDSKWIAYSSDEGGRRDVYVRGFAPDRAPATAVGKWKISTAGGDKPRWGRDGRELYYIALDGKMMAVPVKIGATFERDVAHALFDTRVTGFFPYDVSVDGRFLLNTVAEEPTLSSPIVVVLNWQSALRQRF